MYKKTIIVITIATTGTVAITTAAKLFGITFESKISISDIAAIAALISSAVIFYFGYSRISKSDQIKIARDLMDRIDSKIQKVNEIHNSFSDAKVSEAKTVELMNATNDLAIELDYFRYLLIHEIRDKSILGYYMPRLRNVFEWAEFALEDLKRLGVDMSPSPIPDIDYIRHKLIMIKDSMKFWLDKYPSYSYT